MKYILLVLLLNSLISKTSYAQSKDAKLIVGKWISESDTKSVIVFDKTTEYEYYNNELDFTFSYEIRNDSLITIEKSGKLSVFYYSIENLDKDFLSLTYLKWGNMLIYRRAKK